MSISKLLSFSRYFKKGKGKEPSLQERFQAFQTLLQANNKALEIMGDMEEKYSTGEYVFDRQYIRASYTELRNKVFEMIEALNQMVPHRFHLLYPDF